MASSNKKMLKSSSGRLQQPIRATQPFQLLQQSPARKSPSSSPTPRPSSDARVVNVRSRFSPDHRSSPDRSDRKSPNSPSIKVSNRRSPSPSIRRTSSLDTIAGPYLTGQWPRDFVSIQQHVSYIQSMRDKSTQTDWTTEGAGFGAPLASKPKSSSSHNRSSSISDPVFKQMRQQIRRIAKSSRNSEKKDRTPMVQGNHAALQQLPAAPKPISTPISIGGGQPFGRTPWRQNSNEALNKEIDILFNNKDATGPEPRLFQGVTPPDGHRAPLPRCDTRNMETQTLQDSSDCAMMARGESAGSEAASSQHSRTPSPTAIAQQQHQESASATAQLFAPKTITVAAPRPNSASVLEPENKDAGISPCPKYASSPRPNNSYMFKREPPEGAENVRPFKEQMQDIQLKTISVASCPDKNKVNFRPTLTSAFAPLKTCEIAPQYKLIKPVITIMNGEHNNNNSQQQQQAVSAMSCEMST